MGEYRQYRFLVGIALAVVFGMLAYFGPFTRQPQVTRQAAGQILVGDATGDHARFVIGRATNFSATAFKYNMAMFGGGMFSEFGSRATLLYADDNSYKTAMAMEKRGQCSSGYLSECKAAGKLGYLFLIPADEAAMGSMKSAHLKAGQHFRLTGSLLNFHSARKGGNTVTLQMGQAAFYLVSSIERES